MMMGKGETGKRRVTTVQGIGQMEGFQERKAQTLAQLKDFKGGLRREKKKEIQGKIK